MNNKNNTIVLIAVLILIIGAIAYLQLSKANGTGDIVREDIAEDAAAEKADRYPSAKEIVDPSGFVNTDPLELKDLIGKKVILVDFWTYSCINCQRTFPYLAAWYEKYEDKGLEVVGIHTPEFEFEKDRNNVIRATEKFGIEYPVVLDNDYATWRAYGNRYWPRKYLIDIDGYIVYDHIGEGGYAETERIIQELLEERKERLGEDVDVSKDISNPDNTSTPDGRQVGSPEIYFGSARNSFLGNGTTSPAEQNFEVPERIQENRLYLGGSWRFSAEYAENTGPARIVFRYSAKNVYMVAESETRVRVRVFKDGVFLREVIVESPDLYALIEGQEYGEHTLELQVPDEGLKAFTFTFG